MKTCFQECLQRSPLRDKEYVDKHQKSRSFRQETVRKSYPSPMVWHSPVPQNHGRIYSTSGSDLRDQTKGQLDTLFRDRPLIGRKITDTQKALSLEGSSKLGGPLITPISLAIGAPKENLPGLPVGHGYIDLW